MTGLSPNTIYYVRAYTTNEAGTGYGNEISFNSGYVMGSSQEGGLVFYNDGNGHGLVCAATDQGIHVTWGCEGTAISGADGTVIGTGAQNTIDIEIGCTTAGTAADICANLVLGGYSDWFLPSKDELNLMYVNLKTQSLGGFGTANYWSSSEDRNTYALYQAFHDGYQSYNNKNNIYYVRAVRAF